MQEIEYELLEVKCKGPVLKKAKYRLRMRFWIGGGRSQGHRRKLLKQWAEIKSQNIKT